MRVLAADIGNTSVSMGLFESGELTWSRDYLGEIPWDEIETAGIHGIEKCVVSRVSGRSEHLEEELSHIFDCIVMRMDYARVPLKIRYKHPERLGHDRIANALAARHIAPEGAIVADLGTATHFDIILSDGEFLGGPIAIGLAAMLQALRQRIPHLPEVSPETVNSAISECTEEAIRAGAVLSTAGAVEKIVQSIRHELSRDLKLILKGGYAHLVEPHIQYDIWSPHLTLEGLYRYAEIEESRS